MDKETYAKLVTDYSQALRLVEANLKNLQELNPAIDSVETRIKTLEHIESKCARKKISDKDEESIRDVIRDIAGARVICKYSDNIPEIVEAIRNTPGITIDVEKDYIAHPKDNGYSSFHLCCHVQIYIIGKGTKSVPVEIQVRTMAQNLWATIEHIIRYKNFEMDNPEINASFARIAKLLERIDKEFIKLRDHKNPAK